MPTPESLLWLDGSLVPFQYTGAPLLGHALQRGSLVFDVGAFHETANGPALFRATDHVRRFLRSASIVGLAFEHEADALVTAAVDVVRTSRLAEGLIRWFVFSSAGEPDLLPRDPGTHVAVAVQPLTALPALRPITISVFDDARKAPREVLDPETKAAGAYLGPMLAKRRAIAAGSDDVVLLDTDGKIAEAPIANVFAVRGGALVTPPLGRILPGITRDTTLTLARRAGIPTREEPLARADLEHADEAFLTATSLPIAPIRAVNGHSLGAAPGPITTRLFDAIMAIRRGETASDPPWLTLASSSFQARHSIAKQ
jgi:branched-chain amino acid aminotransferase